MAQANGTVAAALQYLDRNFDDFKRTLVGLSRVPSVSAEGFPPQEVRRSAQGMATALPLSRTTTLRGCASSTASTSALCSGGRSMCFRSAPSSS